MVTGSKELIRDINTQLVLKMIQNEGPISRADVSKKLGLTKATISAIVQVLLDKQVVQEIGSFDAKKGRKPILLTFNKTCGYVVSIDLSPDYITLLSADLAGENCASKRVVNQNDKDSILPVLSELIAEMIDRLPESPYGIVGISLGIHGVVHDNRPVFVPYAPYREIDFAEALHQRFKVPVLLDNEANLAALGEWTHSFHSPNMLSISVHSGIGVGIIMDNSLIRGQNGYAGEFGHAIIAVDGRPCPCGNHGCLDQYASERALLGQLSERKGKKISPEQFARLYQKGDPDAQETMQEFIRYMSVAVNNLLNTFNPETIVINSSFTMNFPEITKEIQKALTNYMRGSCHIEPSLLQDIAILLGGVSQCSRHFIENL